MAHARDVELSNELDPGSAGRRDPTRTVGWIAIAVIASFLVVGFNVPTVPVASPAGAQHARAPEKVPSPARPAALQRAPQRTAAASGGL